MRIVFLGSPAFAIESLKALLNSQHKVVGVVTQPDAIADRGHKLKPCELKVFAKSKNLQVYEFVKISRDGIEKLKSLKPDIMITVAYGQILSQELIDIPRYGIINVHASLLPKYRGASPIQSAIIDGQTETGVTIMQTEAGLDTGDILKVVKTPIYKTETAGQLAERLSVIGAQALIETLQEIEDGTVSRIKQCQNDATITLKLTKLGCTINFFKTAEQISCLVRGSNPNPIARAILNGDAVKVYEAVARPDIESQKVKAGTIIEPTSSKNGVFVQCGVGVLEIITMQLPNGRPLLAKNLVAGRKLGIGMVFDDFASVRV